MKRIAISYEYWLSLSFIAVLLTLFSIRIGNLFIFISCGIWLMGVRENLPHVRKNLKYMLLFSSYYILNVISLWNSDNLNHGFHLLEARLPLIIFPILVFGSALEKRHVNFILAAFTGGVVLVAIGLLIKSGNYLLHATEIDYTNVTYLRLIGAVNIHPTYFSLFISLCVFFILLERKGYLRNLPLWAIVIALVILYILNMLVVARISLFAFFLILLILGAVKLSRKQASKFLLIAAGVGIIGVVVIRFVPAIQGRFADFMKSDPLHEENFTSFAMHIKSWYCAWQNLKDVHFFIGHGTGDERDVLSVCYVANDWRLMADAWLNAHNEYLTVMMKHGVGGLLVFLAVLLIPLYYAAKTKEYLYLSFLLLIAITSLANSLAIHHSVVFYALMNALLFKRMESSSGFDGHQECRWE